MSDNIQIQTNINKPIKRILSIDSGAIKGIIPIYYLYHLEQDIRRLKIYNSIFEAFDMYAGTSVGSIVVGSIVYTELNMTDLVEKVFTKENMSAIFSSNIFLKVYNLIVDRPLYSGQAKTNLIKKYIKDTLIHETRSKDVVIPLYSVDEQSPKFFKSYVTPTDADVEKDPVEIRMFSESDMTVKVAEIIDGSSSAPGFFGPTVYHDKDGIHVALDGTVTSGNPSDIIYADALKMYPNHDIRILSIGTGLANHKEINVSDVLKYGIRQWVIKGSLLSIVSENHDIDDYVTQYFSRANGHKHVRIQETVIDIHLDDVSKYDYLKETAQKWYETTKDHVFRDIFDYVFDPEENI